MTMARPTVTKITTTIHLTNIATTAIMVKHQTATSTSTKATQEVTTKNILNRHTPLTDVQRTKTSFSGYQGKFVCIYLNLTFTHIIIMEF